MTSSGSRNQDPESVFLGDARMLLEEKSKIKALCPFLYFVFMLCDIAITILSFCY